MSVIEVATIRDELGLSPDRDSVLQSVLDKVESTFEKMSGVTLGANTAAVEQKQIEYPEQIFYLDRRPVVSIEAIVGWNRTEEKPSIDDSTEHLEADTDYALVDSEYGEVELYSHRDFILVKYNGGTDTPSDDIVHGITKEVQWILSRDNSENLAMASKGFEKTSGSFREGSHHPAFLEAVRRNKL